MAEKSKRAIVPKFSSEADEAEWWYANRRTVEAEFRMAMRDGTVRRGPAQRLTLPARYFDKVS